MGTQAELTSLVGSKETLRLHLGEDEDAAALTTALAALPGVERASMIDGAVVAVVEDAETIIAPAITAANAAGVRVHSVDIEEPNLEAVFLHLTVAPSATEGPTHGRMRAMRSRTCGSGARFGRLLGLIVAPLALSLALGAAFGGGGTSGVPTVVVDLDGAGGGRFGPLIAGALSSDQLSSLIGVTRADDAATARATVDDGGASVAVVIPAGLSDRVMAAAGGAASLVEVYGRPDRGISAQIVRGVVDGVLAELVAGSTAARVTLASLVEGGYLDPADLATRGGAIGEAAAADARDSAAIAVRQPQASRSRRASPSVTSSVRAGGAVPDVRHDHGGRRSSTSEREGPCRASCHADHGRAGPGGKLAGIAAGGLSR